MNLTCYVQFKYFDARIFLHFFDLKTVEFIDM